MRSAESPVPRPAAFVRTVSAYQPGIVDISTETGAKNLLGLRLTKQKWLAKGGGLLVPPFAVGVAPQGRYEVVLRREFRG